MKGRSLRRKMLHYFFIALIMFVLMFKVLNYAALRIVEKATDTVSKKISEKTDTETVISSPGYSIFPLKFNAGLITVQKAGEKLIVLENCSVNNPVVLLLGKSKNIESTCKTLSLNQAGIIPFVKEKIAGGVQNTGSKQRAGSSSSEYSLDITIERTAVQFEEAAEVFWSNLKMKGLGGVLRIKGVEGLNSEGFLEIIFAIDEKKADVRFENVLLKMFDKLIIKELRPDDYSGIVAGEVKIGKEGDVFLVSTDLTILDIMIEHQLIDNVPYKLPFLRLESSATFDHRNKKVKLAASKVSIGGIDVDFEGSYGPDEKSLKLDVKNATLNKLETLVHGEVFKGFNLNGHVDLSLNYQQIKEEEPVFTIQGEIVDALQRSDRLDYLVSSFQYSFSDRADNVRNFTVGPANDDYTPIEYIPEHVYWAVVISEDAGFFVHPGIDFNELGAAVIDNMKNEKLRGGSTITQQLAKNLFLNRNKTLIRKFQEMLLAVELDSTFSKNRLLEIYLNIIEWAPDVFGISQAAYYYFGKTVYSLTPLEAAYLASVIPGPYKYHYQFLTGNVNEKWIGNLHRVLNIMHEGGHITFEQYLDALGENLTFREKK